MRTQINEIVAETIYQEIIDGNNDFSLDYDMSDNYHIKAEGWCEFDREYEDSTNSSYLSNVVCCINLLDVGVYNDIELELEPLLISVKDIEDIEKRIEERLES